MSDFSVTKGPKDDGSFFERNGTMQDLSSVLGSIQSLSSNSAKGRLGGLSQLIGLIMSLFA